ncbi:MULTISPECIES: hypothetical protein [Pseudomonas]|jgi:hypothetical protein|uniref:Uncharacterized protein n=3 Tax=Pseudomonas TaxID=286 RepID=A0A370S7U6_PSEJE|nr:MULTISPECIES: hypothetical protein [Pseudomonas]MBK3467790.1 hypothetical protein [Pseudomonas sp. MF6776]RDL15815.1 hypothetical protein DEU51_11576 [Pseudomonas jessenii]
MNIFKNKNSPNAQGTYISVNCDLQTSISNRVDFNTQNIEFQQDPNSTRIEFTASAFEKNLVNYGKGMTFRFRSDIQSGSYNPTDSDFPFEIFQYYEVGASDSYSTFYNYSPESGTIDVEVISNDCQALRYLINFDFKGKDHRTEELHITGRAELNVYMRAS